MISPIISKYKKHVTIISLFLFFALWGLSYYRLSEYICVYLFLSMFLLMANVFCILFIQGIKIEPWKISVLVLILGTLYNGILPACTVPDEDFHFATAYKVSNVLISDSTLGSQSNNVYMREDIANSLIREYHGSELVDYYNDFFKKSSDKEILYEDNDVTAASYTYYPYIYSGVVLAVLRVLQLNAHMLLFLGRECNLILFALISFVVLMIFPEMNASFSTILLFPMTLILAASYSYDSIIIASTLMLLAMIMRCVKGKEYIRMWEAVIITLLFAFAIPIKLVYSPILVLLLCIKNSRFKRSWYKYAWILATCVVTICIMLFFHASNVKYYFTKHYSQNTVTEEVQLDEDAYSSDDVEDHEHIWTVSDAKEDPLEFMGIMFRSLFNTSNQLFMNISGYYFGWFTYEIPITIACIFPILFAISIGANRVSFSRSEKVIGAAIIIASGFLIMISMLLAETPYGMSTIRGVQGRYFIPITPLIAVVFSHEDNSPSEKNFFSLIKVSTFMNTIVILYLLNEVIA